MSTKSNVRYRASYFVAVVCIACQQAAWALPPTGTNWGLLFDDEFNGNALDSMKWGNGYPWQATANGASPDNVNVSGGTLNLIQARASDGSFTGSAVTTRLYENPSNSANHTDAFDFTDGYVEARMKLPSKAGSWPAFWMLQGGWPPEVDIMEDPIFTQSTGSSGTKGYNTAYHYTGTGGAASAGGYRNDSTDFSSSFHTWGLLWTSSSMTFYLDGNPTNSVSGLTAAQIQQAKSMYILFTNGGGDWAGTPSQSEWANGTTDQAQVDWVRVWQMTAGTTSKPSWSKAGDGSWDTANMWSSKAVPTLATQIPTFGQVDSSSGSVAVSWNYSHTVGGLTFSGSTNYTLGNASTTPSGLMMANASGTSVIDATAATGATADTIIARLELLSDVTVRAGVKPLAFNGAIIGNGNFNVASGTVTLGGAGTYTGNTTITGGTLKLASGGSLTSPLIDVASGTFDVSANSGFTLAAGQTLRGNGTVAGAMIVLGTLQPGEGAGTLNTGSLTLGNGATLALELGGPVAFDVLNASGTLTLANGSNLNVVLTNYYQPTVGSTFTVLNFTGLNGTFSTINLPALPAGETWDTSALYSKGQLTVTPEPATSLFVLPLVAGLLRRRKH